MPKLTKMANCYGRTDGRTAVPELRKDFSKGKFMKSQSISVHLCHLTDILLVCNIFNIFVGGSLNLL